MKIYTYDATDDTRVEVLWSLKGKNRDPIFSKFIQQTNYQEVNSIKNCDLAIYPYKAFDPETLIFNNSVYDAAQKAAQHNKPIIIDGTSDSDVRLDIPTAQILRCGLYHSLKQTFEVECPFWSNYRTKQGLDALEILPKGNKPKIGFCGTVSSIGKLAQMGKNILPTKLAQTVLSEGKFARKIDVRLKEGMSLRLRTAAIKIFSANSKIESYFNISNPHQSYYYDNDRNRLLLEQLFITNTGKTDYTLCVRGTGNYSGRFYMALNAGRIPVLLDTDVVIPFAERLHIVRVPIQSLNKIDEIVLEHFENTSDKEFREMKAHNRFVYNQFMAPEMFLPNFLDSVVHSPKRSAIAPVKLKKSAK